MTACLIRVDASIESGTGHLMRCILLADYLKFKGIDSTFVTRTSQALTVIREKSFECQFINNLMNFKDEIDIIKNLSEEKKSEIIITDINNHQTFPIITNYHHYLEELNKLSPNVVSFDELKDYPFPSDIVIIPYVGADKLKRRRNSSRYLLGPKYFPLRQEFLKVGRPEIKKNATEILISMGGSDPECITLKVLKAIHKTRLGLNLNIIIGRLSPITKRDIENVLEGFDGTFYIQKNVNNMAKLMMASDLAITNSGLTKYEMAAVGLPSIVISNNKEQAKIMDEFAKQGTVLHLGDVTSVTLDNITAEIIRLINGWEERIRMSEKGKSLVDGNGLNRIYNEIAKEMTHGR